MSDILLHPSTANALDQFIARSFHAGLIIGPRGSGKSTLSRHISARLLDTSIDALLKYPHIRIITSLDGKAIPIETIRELQHFMTLKIPGSNESSTARVAIIEDAHLLTTEAQNALLKTLEEPPQSTVLLLTATSPEALLPTILSRVQQLPIVAPDVAALKEHFEHDFPTAEIDTVLPISGGLPGLTHALLTSNQEHPLYQATAQARTLLQGSAYDRLLLVDALSKQKQQCQDVLFILGQMARMAIVRSAGSNSAAGKRWQTILRSSYQASEQLRRNVQPKLVLTNLMLAL